MRCRTVLGVISLHISWYIRNQNIAERQDFLRKSLIHRKQNKMTCHIMIGKNATMNIICQSYLGFMKRRRQILENSSQIALIAKNFHSFFRESIVLQDLCPMPIYFRRIVRRSRQTLSVRSINKYWIFKNRITTVQHLCKRIFTLQ